MKKTRTLKTVLFSAAATAVAAALVALNAISGSYSVYTFATAKRELPIYGVERNDGKIAISFDCAWGTEYTDKILETLDFYGVKCTFFAVEFWTEKYPEYVKKIAENGHEIGTHSATHSKMSLMSAADIEKELTSSAAAIEKITGKKVELFRPPFGDYDDELIRTAEKLGYYTVQWSVDSLDWKDLSAEEIATRIINKVKSGSIILCHNNGLHTAESLPLVFSELIKRGYEFAPIGELIYRENYEIKRDGTQVQKTA